MLKTQLHSDVKSLESHFWLQPTQKGLRLIRLLPVSPPKKKKTKEKTIAISGLMHICHARRIGGPDGHDTVAGASTNVCGCLCCYLYRSETQTRKYLQKDSGPFLFGVKVIININRWDETFWASVSWTLKNPSVHLKKHLVLEVKQENVKIKVMRSLLN